MKQEKIKKFKRKTYVKRRKYQSFYIERESVFKKAEDTDGTFPICFNKLQR